MVSIWWRWAIAIHTGAAERANRHQIMIWDLGHRGQEVIWRPLRDRSRKNGSSSTWREFQTRACSPLFWYVSILGHSALEFRKPNADVIPESYLGNTGPIGIRHYTTP